MTQYKYPFAFTEDRLILLKATSNWSSRFPTNHHRGGAVFIVLAGSSWMTVMVWTWFSTIIHILLILFTSGMQNWILT